MKQTQTSLLSARSLWTNPFRTNRFRLSFAKGFAGQPPMGCRA